MTDETTTSTNETQVRLDLDLTHAKFPLGKLCATRGAYDELNDADVRDALMRHAIGDWGECCAQDWNLNDEDLIAGNRLLSVYRDGQGTKFWIITEADRSATTVLLPEEY